MNVQMIFALQILLYASIPFLLARLKPPTRAIGFYVYLSLVLFIGGLAGAIYSIPVTETVNISGGNISYGAFMLGTILLLILERDLEVVRNVVRIVITVNVFKTLLFLTIGWALATESIKNPFFTDAMVFQVSVKFLILGGVLIITELLLLIFIFERLKRRVNNIFVLSILYTMFYIAILSLDGVLFPLLGIGFTPALSAIMIGNVQGKFIMAISYSLPILIFLLVFRKNLAAYVEVPFTMVELWKMPREKLVEEVSAHREALRESQTFSQTLVDTSPDLIYIYDIVEQKNIYSNAGIMKILDYTVEELQEMGESVLSSLMHPDDFSVYLDEIYPHYQTLKDGEIFQHEYRMQHKDGTWHWLSSKETIFTRQDDGTPKQIFGLTADITERVQVDMALQESEERFRSLFDDSTDAYLILDENIFVGCNQATVKMLRANSKEEVLSTHPSQLSPEFQPDGQPSAEKADEMIRIALEQGSNRFEWVHRRIDGEDFPVEVLLTPIVVEGKTIVHTVWRDITERKKANEALEASHKRMLTLLNSIPAEIYVSSLQSHKIIFMNDHMREVFGTDMVGQVCYEALRNETGQCSICPYDHLLDKDGNPTEKFVWEGQNPISKKWYVNYDRAVPWTDGRLVHVQIAVDITDRKKIEEALKKSEELFSKAFHSSPSPMVIARQSDGSYLEANESFLRLVEYSREEALGFTSLDLNLMKPDTRAGLIRKARHKEMARNVEVQAQTKSGKPLILVISSEHVELAGEPCTITTMLDITERKEAEDALQKLNVELDDRVEKRTKELNDMLSLMSGRENRMAELKKVITTLRAQLKEAGIEPEAFDPLIGPDREW
ncbi:MAG: PAS domain S-box protein [Anaerolineae bacterium]|nr:PAS domain S-box protein [Anaerolineae bacterium]MBT7601421.1 PAS domain S-box protein [Anaerolineae bacterium]